MTDEQMFRLVEYVRRTTEALEIIVNKVRVVYVDTNDTDTNTDKDILELIS